MNRYIKLIKVLTLISIQIIQICIKLNNNYISIPQRWIFIVILFIN